MKGNWCYWKSHFSADQCDQMIQEAQQVPAVAAGVSNMNSVDQNIRRSQIRWIQRAGYWESIFSEMEKLTKRSNDDWFDVRYNQLPPLQFSEYDAAYQGEYKSHQDVFITSGLDIQRKISFVIQLCKPDSYQGGDLTFQQVDATPPPADIRAQGTVIFFPSLVYHQLTPVTQGIRYSMVGWWEGPAWR